MAKQDRLSGLNTDIYFLTILEATSLRPRCQAGWFLLEPLSWVGEDCLLTASLHSFPSMLVCVLISSSYKDTKVILAYNPNRVTTFYFNYLLVIPLSFLMSSKLSGDWYFYLFLAFRGSNIDLFWKINKVAFFFKESRNSAYYSIELHFANKFINRMHLETLTELMYISTM